MNKLDKKLIEKITKKIVNELNKESQGYVPVGVSNRHIHLSKKDLEALFGKGYELTKIKDLKQPGQFAAKETIKVKGPKGLFEKVRILGPTRNKTQIEISLSDSYKLGVAAPVRESGKLENTSGVTIEGPKGLIKKENGVIAALRHIHMPPDVADKLGLKDKQRISVMSEGERKARFYNVLVRVSDKYALEMHLDTDEANSAGIKNGDKVKIIND